MQEQRNEILKILGKHGPLRLGGIWDHAESIADKPALSSLLHAMKKDGEIIQDAQQQPYRLPGQSPAVTPAKAAPPARAVRQPAHTEPAKAGRGGHEEIAALRELLDNTQAALDDYIAAVCDQRIIGPLRAARDSVRNRLAELNVEIDR